MMDIMVLCAGEGTRFRPHTLKTPKPAIPFLNVPLAFYSLAALSELRPQKLVANSFHLKLSIEKLFESPLIKPQHIQNIFVREDGEKILGSAGGLKNCEDLLSESENIVLCNGDEVFLSHEYGQFQKASDFHIAEKNLATLLVMEHEGVGTQFGGIWTDSQGIVRDIGKTTELKGLKASHYIGVGYFNKKIFNSIPSGVEQNIFYDTLKPLLAEGRVQIYPFRGDWYETGNLKSYLSATAACLEHLRNHDDSGKYLEKVLAHFSPSSSLFEEENGALILTSKSVHHQIINTGSQVSHFAVIDPIQHILSKSKFDQAVLADSYKLHDASSGLSNDGQPCTLFENNLFL